MKTTFTNQFDLKILLLGLVFLFGFNPPHILAEAPLSEKAAIAQLEKIKEINHEDSQQALTLLAKLQASITTQSSIALRREYLSVLISAKTDVGAIDDAWENALALEKLGVDESDEGSRAEGITSQGAVLVSKGKIEDAIKLFNQAIPIAEAIQDHKLAYYTYNNLALAENTIGKFQDSLTHFIEATNHSEKIEKGKERRLSALYNNISLLYMSLRDPDNGFKYNQMAFEMAEKSGSKGMLATLALNRGYAYDDIGEIDKAYDSYLIGLNIARETKSIRSEAVALINISDIFLRKKDFHESAKFGQMAIEASEKTGEQSYLATATSNLGVALAGMGKVDEGAEKVIAAINIFKASKSKLEQEATLGELANLYFNAERYKAAFEVISEKMILSEQIYVSERDKTVAELQEKFNANEQKKKIELLERENQNKQLQQQVTILIAVVVIFAAILVYLLYRKVRKTNKKLEDANSQLEVQSVSDPLTGLFNRRCFLNLMELREKIKERRVSNPTFPDSLVLLDVDNFKHVNDTYGHTAGDAVLVEISSRLKSLMRDTDMVLRWGGEEFLIFVKQPDPDSIKKVVKKILDAIGSKPISIGDRSLQVTVSAGEITLPFGNLTEQEFNWERALQLADMALYLGKVHGRNRAYCVNKLLAPFDIVKPLLEKDLAEAMAKELVSVEAVLGPVISN